MANKKTVAKKTPRRNRKNIEKGAAHIHSSFNNTIVTITDNTRKCNFMGKCRRIRI